MVSAFSPLFITLYIYKAPLAVATRIFETFLVGGDAALIKILFKMMAHKRRKILSSFDVELMDFIKKDMVVECFNELTIEELVNY